MRELYEFDRSDAFRFAEGTGIEHFPKGDELVFKYCPYCKGGRNHDLKTFSINLLTGAWNCKRGQCGKTGNMITLVKEFDWFSLGTGIDDYYRRTERFRSFKPKKIEVKDGAIQYLEKRGIPAEITRKYEITISGKHGKDNVMVFPFKDETGTSNMRKAKQKAVRNGASQTRSQSCSE